MMLGFPASVWLAGVHLLPHAVRLVDTHFQLLPIGLCLNGSSSAAGAHPGGLSLTQAQCGLQERC